MKKTKIICTLGPSTDQQETIEQMLAAGMNVARFNFSHGTHDEHEKRMNMVRAAAVTVKKPVGLMLDTKGPEMRLGRFTTGKVNLEAGQKLVLTCKDVVGDRNIVSVSHRGLYQEVVPGNDILLSDGLISLKVDRVIGKDIVTTVQNSGQVSDLKRVAVPGVGVHLPFLSEKDVDDIIFGVKQNVDFIAASFVQRAADILAIRKVLEDADAAVDIIAKIENAEGVKNIDEILKVADGVMVARGDLGVEIPAEDVPLIQKMLIEKCNKIGKPVITATQMLESMVTNPRPTRAEANDVANAIFDGTDGIMLSGETASGQYPVEAVETMAKIAVRIETALKYSDILKNKGILLQCTTTDAISHATVQIAQELGAAAVIVSTQTGYTARMASKYRPKAVIVAVTPSEKTLRRMTLQWGVYPLLGNESANSDEMEQKAVTCAFTAKYINEGDLVVMTAGAPGFTAGTTDMIRVHSVGNILLRGIGIGQCAAAGKVCVALTSKEVKEKFRSGDVLVVSGIDEETACYAVQAAAIVAEEGGITSQAAIVGISYGLPVVVGADGATRRLTHGGIVTVDAARGLVYSGRVNTR